MVDKGRNTNIDNHNDMSSVMIDAFIALVSEKMGIQVGNDVSKLTAVLFAISQKYQLSIDELYNEIAIDHCDLTIMNEIAHAITVNETYFFRDQKQMDALYYDILPSLIADRSTTSRSLRIWSAGCSSGEEIYTIVIMLNELISNYLSWRICCLGTDININILKKAKQGLYSSWSMRTIDPKILNKYFIKDGQQYQLDRNIMDSVMFEYLNLKSNNYPSVINNTANVDLILCCNVLIYFDSQSINHTLGRLTSCLSENGILMLGASDPNNVNLQVMSHYKRYSSTFIKFVGQESDTPVSMVEQNDVSHEEEAPANEIITTAVDELVHHDTPHLDNTIQVVQQLANSGQLVKALKMCNDLIRNNTHSDELYLTYAMILDGLGNKHEADAAYKSALYLNQSSVIAHYYYGLFMIHGHREKQGIKQLEVALSIARKKSKSDIVPGAQNNITYDEIIPQLERELQLHSQIGSIK